MKKVLLYFLLGRKHKIFHFVKIRGKNYLIDIHPHEPADEFVDRLEKDLHEQGLND